MHIIHLFLTDSKNFKTRSITNQINTYRYITLNYSNTSQSINIIQYYCNLYTSEKPIFFFFNLFYHHEDKNVFPLNYLFVLGTKDNFFYLIMISLASISRDVINFIRNNNCNTRFVCFTN